MLKEGAARDRPFCCIELQLVGACAIRLTLIQRVMSPLLVVKPVELAVKDFRV